MADQSNEGLDLSGLHREIDRVKSQLCRCGHRGECIACQGFEMLRQQAQMVVAAASQPVLMQVAQEAAIKDLLTQMGGAQEKLMGDPRLMDLVGQMMERIQEDLGGPEAVQRMFGGMGGFPGFGPGGPASGGGGGTPPEDVPPDERPWDDRPRRPDAG
jgi:hypothetical protein